MVNDLETAWITGTFTLLGVLLGATVTLVIHWLDNRHKLAVVVDMGNPKLTGNIIATSNMFVRIINSGHRPIHVSGCFIKLENNNWVLPKESSMPAMLAESEYVVQKFTMSEILNLDEGLGIKTIYVHDVFGKKTEVSKKYIKAINLRLQELRENVNRSSSTQ